MQAKNPVPIRRFDPVIEILIPFCIVGLVGSLIYFLIDLRAVLIAGSKTQLRVVSAALLVACVQIARIRAYTQSRWIAALFTLLTLGAVGFFIIAFTNPYFLDQPRGQPLPGAARHLIPSRSGPYVALALHAFIVALIWWSTSILTTACTLDPDVDEIKGEGMLARLLRSRPLSPTLPSLGREEGPREGLERALVPPLYHWRRRYHPGQAVIYFGLIALVVFGLGQRLLAGGPPELRRDGLICMLASIFFALLLLSLTSLSGLRLYLRQRAVAMPRGTTPIWILFSFLTVSFILAAAYFLPKPQPRAAALIAQRPAEDFRQQPMHPRRWGPFPGFRPTDEPSPRTEEGGSRETLGGPPAEGDRGREGTPPGRSGQGQTRPEGSPSGTGKRGGPTSPGGPVRPSPRGTGSNPENRAASNQDTQRSQDRSQAGRQAAGAGEATSASHPSDDQDARSRSFSLNLRGCSGWWWLLLLLLILLYLFYRKRREIAAKVKAWWHRQKHWLPLGLVAWLERVTAAVQRLWKRVRRWWIARYLAQMAEVLRRRRAVDPFQNPFAPGSPFQSRPLRDLVMHIYHALLAYAALQGCERAPHQTPLEYLRDLPKPLEPLRRDVEFLTNLYVQAAYTGQPVAPDCLPALQNFWPRLMAQVRLARPKATGRA